MTLSRRLLLSMVLLAAATATLVGVFIYRDMEEAIVPIEMRRLESAAFVLAQGLDAYARDARADTLALRGSATVDGIVRAEQSGGRDPVSGLTSQQWKDHLAQLFEAVVRAKPNYVKLRLIGLADGGKEIVRVDRMGDAGIVRRVPEGELQRKGNRAFVPDVVALDDGQVYVSSVDLNQEQGTIAYPLMPVLRTGTPVYGPDGKPFGLILINLDMRPAFDHVRAQSGGGARLFVVNEDGDYLVHPDTRREFAFELGPPARVQQDMPGIKLSAADTAGHTTAKLGDETFAVAYSGTRLAGGPRVTVLKSVPYGQISAPMVTIRNSALLAGAIAAVVAVLLGIILARSLSRPITRMTAAVEGLQSGRAMSLPLDSPGEVGVLARAFEHYMQRERLFSAALDSSEDAVMACDPQGIITGWNPAAERLYGYKPGEIVGKHARMLVPEDKLAALEHNIRTIADGHGFNDRDVVHVAKDGRRLPLEARVSAVRGPSGELIGSLAIISDISEKRQLEAKFRMSFEASPSGMLLVDENGLITLANVQIAAMFGYDGDALLGQPLDMLLPDRYRAGHPANLRSFMADPSARSMGAGRDLRGRRQDGSEFPVEIGLQPIATEAGLLVLGVIVDISERQKAAAILAAKTAELERSNAELEQFAYVASHDLREPLRMVASYTELLTDRYAGKLDERADKYIAYINDGARRMQRLVSDLLALSRVGTQGKAMEPVDAGLVLKNVMRSMTPTIRESCANIEPRALPTVVADEVQLGQLFQNLIGNAIKFRAPDRLPSIIIDARRSNGSWEFSVQDNGIGIASQYSERIFQMFQRLHGRDEYEGNGIGLAIAKKIVERHGGNIWLSSTVGEGTSFYFTLPAQEERGMS